MKHKSNIGLFICCLSLFLMTAITDAPAEARTYKIGVVPWAGWSGMHVSEANGFFKSEGADVNIVTFPSSQAMYAAMKKGILDIGFDMVGSIVGFHLDGGEYVVIAETNWSHGGDKIVAKKGVRLSEMKGKPLGVYFNMPSVTFFLNKYLAAQNLKLSDFRILEMETDQLAEKFISGLFSVIVAYDPDALKAEREGGGQVMATSASYEGCIPEGMFMLKSTLAKTPGEDLKKIFRGYLKGVAWLHDATNWPVYKKILNDRTFKDDLPYSEKDLKGMIDSVAIHDRDTLLSRNKTGGGLEMYFRELRGFLEENGMLRKEFTAADLFDNRLFLEALE